MNLKLTSYCEHVKKKKMKLLLLASHSVFSFETFKLILTNWPQQRSATKQEKVGMLR